MNYQETHVIFIDSANADFGSQHALAGVIGEWTVEAINGEFFFFRKITERTAKGKPVVDLAATKLFSLAITTLDCEISIRDMIGLTVIELAEKYAK